MLLPTFETLLIFCVAGSLAATTPCLGPPDRLPAWACILCGPNTDQCLPYNATEFDDLRVGKAVGTYNDVTWTNFMVEDALATGDVFRLVPVSPPHLARVPAGQHGDMLTSGGELIYDFHYGCTTPASSKQVLPISCIVSLKASCSYSRASAEPWSWKFNFNTTLQRRTMLAGYDKSKGYVGPGYGACANFSWSAAGINGRPVDLYLDEVIYKRVPYW